LPAARSIEAHVNGDIPTFVAGADQRAVRKVVGYDAEREPS
jgi:hypothetical protein